MLAAMGQPCALVYFSMLECNSMLGAGGPVSLCARRILGNHDEMVLISTLSCSHIYSRKRNVISGNY
jgi:hypothetical protein